MAARTWTVIDVEKGQYLDSADGVQVFSLADEKDFRVQKSTRRGGLSDGVDVLQVTNGDLAFRLLPTRGMSVWDAHYRGERIGWNSPVRGPVHPKFVPLSEPSGLGWLDGFNELLVRCGLESNGAPEFDEDGRLKYPLHGRIANRPAQLVEVALNDDEITITGRVEEARFHFLNLRLSTRFQTRRGETGFRLMDEITNLSATPAEVQILYHTNFGQPLLDAGSQVVVPAKTVVPRNDHAAGDIESWDSYAAEQPGFEEQVYFMELLADENNRSRAMLKNAHGTRAVSLVFGKQTLPCFTLWKDTAAAADGYVTGLEPATNFPNPRSFEGEQGRVAQLPPGGKISLELALEVHHGEEEVKGAEARISAIQGDTQPRVYHQPQAGWCAP